MKKEISFKSILDSIKKDFKLKAISLGLGIIMWFFVIGGENPIVTRQFRDIHVKFKDEALLERKKLLIIEPIEPKINVEIKGHRNEVYAINRNDIIAEIDLAYFNTSGTYRMNVNVNVPHTVEISSISESELSVAIDDEISKTFDVTVEIKGEMKNKNQVVVKKEPDTKVVALTGPASYIKKVKKVVADIDITGKESDEVVLSKIYPVDENGKIVDGVELSNTDTNVSIGFKNFKEVSIKLVDINTPPNDIRILRKNLVPEFVSVVGSITSLEQITEIKTKPFDLSQIKEAGPYDLSLELPKDITLVNKDLKVVVNIDVDKKIEKVLKVKTKGIIIEGATDIILQGLTDSVDVTVRGYESVISRLKEEDIKLYVSVSESDIGKNVQIKAKDMNDVEIVKILDDIVQVIAK